jgi:WhiB family redox-sensing transcriptional regulator
VIEDLINDDGSIKHDWRDRAACAGLDTNFFFPEGSGETGKREYRAAKLVCAGCPVKQQCLDYAVLLGLGPGTGVYGGTTPTERAAAIKVARKRASNCPRCMNLFVEERTKLSQHLCPRCNAADEIGDDALRVA